MLLVMIGVLVMLNAVVVVDSIERYTGGSMEREVVQAVVFRIADAASEANAASANNGISAVRFKLPQTLSGRYYHVLANGTQVKVVVEDSTYTFDLDVEVYGSAGGGEQCIISRNSHAQIV